MTDEIDTNTRYVRKDCQGTQVDDDLVIFDPETGFYFDIGGVGVVIWEMLAEPRSIEEVCEFLREQYDVEERTCNSQVTLFVGEMKQCGLLLASPD